jgi:tRNA nucleotidyltransferase (CCA-adding enzyme)
MVDSGEISNLVAERVWQELEAALTASSPRAFVETLRACGALSIILPELDKLFGVPQTAQWHPEIDSGIHTLMVLDQAALLSDTVDVRLAALFHDLGKGETPEAEWPSHRNHDVRGADIIKKVAARLRIPKRLRDLSILTAQYHLRVHEAMILKPTTLVKLMQSLDVIRKPERFEHFLLACEADSRGRLGLENRPLPELDFLRETADIFRQVDSAAIASNTENKAEIPEALRLARIVAIRQWQNLRDQA